MYEALIERSLRSVEAVKRHVDASHSIRSLIAQGQIVCKNSQPCFDLKPFYERAPSVTDWRVIDHCSAVTRLYAIYEQFVHELIRAFLSFLEATASYQELDHKLREEHRRHLGQVLMHMDRERFRSLRFESIIGDLANAFSDHGSYRLLPEAMLAHDQNLRLSELSSLFARCGVKDVSTWVSKHFALKQFFSAQDRQSDKAESELKLLVDYRNDAAHGGIEVDAVLGPDILIEFADFLIALFHALVECVRWSVVERSLEYKKTRLAGKVNEVYSKNIVVAIVENTTFTVGDFVYLRGDAYCFPVKILSLQVDGVDRQKETVLKPSELGLRFDSKARIGSEIYYIKYSEGSGASNSDSESPENASESSIEVTASSDEAVRDVAAPQTSPVSTSPIGKDGAD